MIDVKKVEDFEKLTTALNDISEAIENMPTPTGGGIDYSINEQNMGIKWIDGKDIYFKSGIYNIPSGVGNHIVETNITQYIDKLLDIKLCLYYTDGSYQYTPIYIGSTQSGSMSIINNDLCLNSINESLDAYTAFYTIYYTKL